MSKNSKNDDIFSEFGVSPEEVLNIKKATEAKGKIKLKKEMDVINESILNIEKEILIIMERIDYLMDSKIDNNGVGDYDYAMGKLADIVSASIDLEDTLLKINSTIKEI